MKKIFMLVLLLLLLTACEEFRYGEEKDDGTISGTVSFLWNQIGVSTAYAQTPQDYLDELNTLVQSNDFFSLYADPDYSETLNSTLIDAQYYATEIGSLLTSNVLGVSSADLASGAILVFGFDSDRRLLSMHIEKVNPDGRYTISDPAFKSVSYYRLNFLLNVGGAPRYRQSYVFRDGKKMKSNVTEATSAASLKLTKIVGSDASLSVPQMASQFKTFNSFSKNSPTSTDLELIQLYVNSYYPTYSILGPIPKFILNATLHFEMQRNQTLRTSMYDMKDNFESYLALARPATLENFSINNYVEEELFQPIQDCVDKLVTLRLIPEPAR